MAADEITRVAFEESGTRYWVLPDFLAAIQEAVANIPEDKRAETLVTLEGDYDEYGRLRISYEDLETEAEAVARIEDSLRYAAQAEERERAELERLTKKYADKPA